MPPVPCATSATALRPAVGGERASTARAEAEMAALIDACATALGLAAGDIGRYRIIQDSALPVQAVRVSSNRGRCAPRLIHLAAQRATVPSRR